MVGGDTGPAGVAVEAPCGPVVERRMERGFVASSINTRRPDGCETASRQRSVLFWRPRAQHGLVQPCRRSGDGCVRLTIRHPAGLRTLR